MQDKNLKSCEDCADCNSIACEQCVLTMHSITQVQFDQMVDNYFYAVVTVPKVYTAIDIKMLIEGKNCETSKIQVMFSRYDHATNSEISLMIVPMTAHDPNAVYYSIPLFRGVLRNFSVNTFHFSKAYEFTSATVIDPTVIFQAVDSFGTVVYLGDLTQTFP